MPVFEITAPDGRTFDVEGPDAQGALAALTKALGGASSAPQKQEMVGFGSRENREQDMPETPDLRREIDVSKRMAMRRPGSPHQQETSFGGITPDFLNPEVVSGKDAFLQNYTFGLRDEARAFGAGLASAATGGGYSHGYDIEKEADRRLREEYADQNPGTNLVLSAAGMLAGGLPAKPSSAATLGEKVVEGAGQAATQGAVQGFAEGDEGRYGRLGGAAIGGATGGLIGAAAPALVAGVKGATGGVRNTINTALNPEKEAARRVAQALEKDAKAGGDGLDNIGFSEAKQAGNPVANMDRGGKNVRDLARAAGNQSSDAWQAMDDVIKPRFETQARRIGAELEGQSKLGGNPEKFMEMADEAATRANRTLYGDAYAKGSDSIWTPELERIASTAEVQTALKAAIKKAASRNILDGFGAMNPKVGLDEFGNIVFRDKGGMPAYPDLRLWDLTKRELDRMGKMAARNSDSDASLYSGLARKLKAELTSLPEAGPAYAKALQTAASHFGAENAYEAGMKFAAQKGMSAREAIKGLSKLKPEERKLFREGYIQAMRDTLKDAPKNRDALLMIMQSDGAADRARVALGKDGGKKLEAQLEVEKAMDLMRKSMGNSTTARQLAQLGLASAAGSSAMAANGNTDIGSLTAGAIAGAGLKWGKGRLDEKLAAHIGKLLSSNDPGKITLLIKTASQSPKYMQTLRALSQSLGQETPALIGREITSRVANP
jgi:hypothetical protein